MPRINLTDAAIQRLKRPADSPIDYWDTTLRGLGLRIAPSGRKTFNVQTKVLRKGRRRDTRIKLGVYPEISLAEARTKAVEVKRQASDDLDPIAVRAQDSVAAVAASLRAVSTAFANVRQQFLDEHLPTLRPSTAKEYKRVLTQAFTVWDTIPVEEITSQMVETALAAVKAPYMRNRTRAYLSVLFNWTVEEQNLIAASPVRKLSKRKKKMVKEASRSRFLTEDEISELWNTESPHPIGALFKLLLLTGQRRSEVAGMRWKDLDLDQALWTIPGSLTKNHEQHTVPLSKQVLAVLATLPHIGEEFVITTTGQTPFSGFSKSKAALDEEAGVTGWRWHDLRRTFATFAAEELTTPQAVVEAILNHKSGTTSGLAGIYNRAQYTKQKAEALQAWANLLDRITGEVVANDDDKVVLLR
jgi:integrase